MSCGRSVVAVILLSLFPVAASAFPTDLGNSVTGSVSDGSATIPYRLFEPQGVAAGQKVPLVLFLHGMGERGTDNVAQTFWMSGLQRATESGQYAAYVLAPQINTNMWFSSPSDKPTEAMSLTIDALKQAMSNPNVDTSRVYVTGVSMGSFGTWDILRREPKLFAAAVPLSGGGDPSTAWTMKDTPIWAFHGSADEVVSVETTRAMIKAVLDAGGLPKYTEVAGGGHTIWDSAYGDAANVLYPWLFSQHLGDGLGAEMLTAAGGGAAAPQVAEVYHAVVAVPEPGSLAVLMVGGLALLSRARYRAGLRKARL